MSTTAYSQSSTLLRTLCALALVAISVFASAPAAAQCTGRWLPGDPLPAISGKLLTACCFDDGSGPRLFVGGTFVAAGATMAANVACWNGAEWQPVGAGFNNTVLKLYVFNGALYASGVFTTSGKTPVARIARWDGAQWQPLGAGLSGRADDMIDYNGELAVCGGFGGAGGAPARFVAKWNGSTWSPLGSGFNGVSDKLAVYQGKLIASGTFTDAGGTPAQRIAAWDGTSWGTLGSGVNGIPTAMAVYGNLLYVAGSMTNAGGVSVRRIATWNGSTWANAGAGLAGSVPVRSFVHFHGELLANLLEFEGQAVHGTVLAFNGSQWRIIGESSPRQPGASALATDGERLFAANITFNPPVENVLELVGNSWEPVGELSWSGFAQAAIEHQGRLVVGGKFTLAGAAPAYNVVRLDESGWTPLGSEIDNLVRALTVYDGELIAGGDFSMNRARWDGAKWSQMGSRNTGRIYSLLVHNGELFAGGYEVYRWNGQEWDSIRDPLTLMGEITSLVTFQGKIVAGGVFEIAGQRDIVLAVWNGSTWSPLAPITHGPINALAVHNDELIVAGNTLTTINNVQGGILAWNGATARTLGTVPEVTALANYNGRLAAIGLFTTGRIAQWDGAAWTALPGTSTIVGNPLGLGTADHNLVAVGDFSILGDQVSVNVARWRAYHADFDGDGFICAPDFDLFVQAFESGEADFDADGFTTGIDFDLFVQTFEAGC